MTDAPWMDFAWPELGVRETPGPGNNPRVLTYHKSTTLLASSDEVAWCSAFACWCVENAGVKSTDSAAARSWLSWGVSCGDRYGAVAVLSRGTNVAQGHVGFFLHRAAGRIWLLGGNQGDAVSVASFDAIRLLDLRWAA
jgi:uncharacterized protein (TIGR02594 family)